MNKTNVIWVSLLVAMASVIAVSNYLVQFPLNDWITLAAFTYPMAFLVTDLTNRVFGLGKARAIVVYGFALGVILSFVTSDIRIAAASGIAFFTSQIIDVSIFNVFRQSKWWKAPIISSSVGSVLDTFLFFSIAFVGTGVPWVSLSLGDLIAKFVMLLVLLPPYRIISKSLMNKVSGSYL